jgi:hypothetical protein
VVILLWYCLGGRYIHSHWYAYGYVNVQLYFSHTIVGTYDPIQCTSTCNVAWIPGTGTRGARYLPCKYVIPLLNDMHTHNIAIVWPSRTYWFTPTMRQHERIRNRYSSQVKGNVLQKKITSFSKVRGNFMRPCPKCIAVIAHTIVPCILSNKLVIINIKGAIVAALPYR